MRGIALSDAEDLISELWKHLLDNDAHALRMFGGRAAMRTYLYRVLDRAAQSFILKLAHGRSLKPTGGSDVALSEHTSLTKYGSRRYANGAAVLDRIFLAEVLSGLPALERMLLEAWFEGEHYAEIGHRTCLSSKAVEHRIQRALVTLRRRFGTVPR